VAAKLGCRPSEPTLLFEDVDGAGAIPDDGRPLLIGLPAVLTCEEEIVRHSWFLPAVPIMLSVRLRGTTLMHPPCPDSLAADYIALAKLFGIDKFVSNPSNMTTAVLGFGKHADSTTVEQWWTAHF